MRELIQQRLREIGIPGQTDIEPMKPGLGKTALWKVSGAGQNGDLVLRLFPAHDTVTADREALAMRTMREHGLPVPDVVATGMIAERPVMITTFAPGKTAGAEMKQAPERARYTGRQLGVLLGEMHAILAPPDLAPPDRWIVRGGAALEPLHRQFRALPNADRLLHLDYHPENVMMLVGQVSAIIDWTNTLPGPPHIDLGRGRATLQMIQSLPDLPAGVGETVARFEDGLVEGHASVLGADPHPELSLAWGVASICVDFEPQAENPESWVTTELVAQLREKRDALIAACL